MCWAMRWDVTPIIYLVGGMEDRDARAEEKILAKLLSEKWQSEYSEMVVFIQVQMSLELVRSNTLLLKRTAG